MNSEKTRKAKLALYKLEFKLQKRSTIWWLAILSILLVVSVLIYPMIDTMMGAIPADEMQELEQMGLSFDFASVTQYFLFECLQTLALGGALFLCCYMVNAMARDFKGRQNELLYTNSLSRSDIVMTKYSATITMIFVYNILMLVLSLIAMAIVDFKGIEIVPILSVILNSLVLDILLVSIVFAIFLFRPKSGYGIALAVPLILYFLAVIGMALASQGGLQFVEYLTPFTPIFDITASQPFDINAWPLLLYALVAVVLMVFGMRKFNKFDM